MSGTAVFGVYSGKSPMTVGYRIGMLYGVAQHAFRFGIVAAPGQRPGEIATAWTSLAGHVENAGYSTLLVPDTNHTLSAIPACAVAATCSTALRVGPYVLSVPNRTSGQVAHDAVAMHLLTGGRFELGLGAGRPGAESDAAAFGMPFGSPSERIWQLETTAAAVRAASPAVPIMIAGSGPKLLSLAGRIADTVAFGLPPEAGIDELGTAVDRVRRGAGDRFDDIELSINLLCIGDEPPPYLRRFLNIDVPTLIARGAISLLTGSVQQMVDSVNRLRDGLGISYICAGEAFVDQLAPVVQQLAGT